MTELPQGSVTIPEGVMIRDLGGESVLLNLDSESYFGLDDVGTAMWQALTTESSVEGAFGTLRAAYDVEPGQLRQDLADFIDSLVKAGLIRVGGA